jgi:hypothetical protein
VPQRACARRLGEQVVAEQRLVGGHRRPAGVVVQLDQRLRELPRRGLGIDPAVGKAVAQARQRFESALPGIKHMLDALMHFDDWSRGQGIVGPQKDRRDAGMALRDVAREYSGFGYDPTKATITLGLYTINVDTADRVAAELSEAIYLAAHEVDKKNTAELRSRTIDALTDAGLRCDAPDAVLSASSGRDLHIWLSLNTVPDESDRQRAVLAEQILAALTAHGLSSNRPTRPGLSNQRGGWYGPRNCTSRRTLEYEADGLATVDTCVQETDSLRAHIGWSGRIDFQLKQPRTRAQRLPYRIDDPIRHPSLLSERQAAKRTIGTPRRYT